MNTILICKCCSQIFELCHAFEGPIPYLYVLRRLNSAVISRQVSPASLLDVSDGNFQSALVDK
jgi:hypothetical protein